MGKKTIIPLGPYHPLQEEPEFYQLTVDGETVVDIDVRIGYVHRGIEKIAEEWAKASIKGRQRGRGGVLTFWGIGYNQMLHGQYNTISIIFYIIDIILSYEYSIVSSIGVVE